MGREQDGDEGREEEAAIDYNCQSNANLIALKTRFEYLLLARQKGEREGYKP